METVRGALRDLRRAYVFTRLFHGFINALIIFLFFALLLLIFKQQWVYALIPALLYLAYVIYRSIMRSRYKDIESVVPELRWQLRTVNDNIHVENEVVKNLKETVLNRAREVRTSYFVDNRVTMYKLFCIFGLSFVVVMFSAFSVSFPDLKDISPAKFIGKMIGDKQGPAEELQYDGALEKSRRSIYGKEGVVAIGTEELELEVKPEADKANLQQQKTPEDQNFDQSGVLNDIGAAPDRSYEDRFKKEESELVKAYLKKLTEYSNRERR